MNTILCFSGGLDSTCLLYHLLSQGHSVRCLSVNYGQRHRRELVAAVDICRFAGVEHSTVDLGETVKQLLAGSSQTSPEVAVPEGHYTEASMKATVVPNRNMLLLSLATCWAVATRSAAVAYAAHAGDHTIYPDCRPEFAEQMADAMKLCDWHPVKLLRPFLYPAPLDKKQVLIRGWDLKAPLHLTYSCYKGGEQHCGKCGTCVERREAFQLAGVSDPTIYEV